MPLNYSELKLNLRTCIALKSKQVAEPVEASLGSQNGFDKLSHLNL